MKFISIFFTFFLLFSFMTPIEADENLYEISDSAENEKLAEFSSYSEAIHYFNVHKDEFENITLTENNRVIETEYALVYFKNEEGCQLIETDDDSSINGCMAVDGLYLYSEYDEVYYMISGAVYHSNISELTIVPVDEKPEECSIYEVRDGVLYHNIVNGIIEGYYAYSIELDDAPDDLPDNHSYYSPDGHYFYENYHEMTDDYREGTHFHAANRDPYYNYYLYLPLRSESFYDFNTVNDYFENTLGINAKLDSYNDDNGDGANDYVNRSQLYEELDAFFTSENIYGINAMSLLSFSVMESGYGKSSASFLDNNLFWNAAFRADEKDLQRYEHLENSVYSFARYYLVDKYLNPNKKSYHGGHLGNRFSGISVSYSSDPYYGEKVASVYYRMDRDLGYKDKDRECIALVNGKHNIYSDEEQNEILYTVSDNEISYIVLEESTDFYKILTDKSIGNNGSYNFKSNVGYIEKENVTLLNKEGIHENEYSEYSFDLNEGKISNLTTLDFVSSKSINEPEPYKEGYEFVGYKDNIAQYKKISSIKVFDLTEPVEVGGSMDLTGAKIKVRYEDGKTKTLDLNSEMVKEYDSNKGVFIFSYNGVTEEVTLETVDRTEEKEEIQNDIEKLVSDYKEGKECDRDKLDYVISHIEEADLSMDEIRILDLLNVSKEGSPVFYVEGGDYDFSYSGLSLAFDMDKETVMLQLYENTYYIQSSDISIKSRKILEKYASAYGFEVAGAASFFFRYNLNSVSNRCPIVAGVRLSNKDDSSIYSVYHLDSDGNIVKCYTTQRNSTISFVIEESGDYIFLSKKSANTYHLLSMVENYSAYDNHRDSFREMVEIMIFFIMILYCLISYVIYKRLEGINRKIFQRYERMLEMPSLKSRK